MKRRMTVPVAVLTALSFSSITLAGDNKKNDPDAIGDRNVGKGVNFYSLQKEIALGKEMAERVP